MKSVLLPVLWLAFLGAGCSSDENTLNEDDSRLQPLNIRAAILAPESIRPETRAIVYGTVFPDGSQIGVHVAQGVVSDPSGNKGAPGTPYSPDYYTNQMFQLDGTVWIPNAPYNLGSEKGTVYAYSPFDPDARFNTPGSATIPVAILQAGTITVQSGSAATDNVNNNDAITTPAAGENDYMYYKPVSARATVSNRQHSVLLTMQHALAQVSFRVIKAPNYPGSGNFTGYAVSDAGTTSHITVRAASAVMSIADGSLTIDTPEKGTITRDLVNYQLGYDLAQATIVGSLVYPVSSIAGGDLSVVFHIDAQDYTAQLPVTASVSDAWLAGKNYLYSVTLSGTGIEITTVSITDWDNVPAGEIEIE